MPTVMSVIRATDQCGLVFAAATTHLPLNCGGLLDPDTARSNARIISCASVNLHGRNDMLIELDLNANEAESLLHHRVAYQPASGDFREDSRLSETL